MASIVHKILTRTLQNALFLLGQTPRQTVSQASVYVVKFEPLSTKGEHMWPFPPPSGPTPWTRKQEQEYNRQQREQQGDAPW